MLKSEHLLYRITSPNIRPRFLDPSAPFLLDLAAELISLYSGAMASSMFRHELEEITGSVIRGSFDLKIASGLNKLLLDRCEFSSAEELDYPAVRRESFLRAAELIDSGCFSMEQLQQCAGTPDLYGDLPDFEKLTAFKDISAVMLLHRYNMAQSQGLLFHADSLHLEIPATEPTELRKFMKAIKFFRLLAHIRKTENGKFLIDISGPCSIFGTTAKYALQFANLLPAIVNLPAWKLEAVIHIKNRKLLLKLSPKNELVSHYRNLAGYIPEEIKIFHHSFNDKQKLWQIIGDTPFLDGGEQELIFPDLSFRNTENDQVFHVELFHRWHAAGLQQRIELLAEKPELPLLLGIDRALVKSEEDFENLFANYPHIREKCWLFRDFPGVSSTVNVLKKASQRSK